MCVCRVYVFGCNLEAKKNKQSMTALPSAAVGKGPFAEGFVPVRSAHLGNLTPSLVFPAVPSVLAQGTRHSWEHPDPGLPALPSVGRRQRCNLCRRPGVSRRRSLFF
jgi:hypothetical protein